MTELSKDRLLEGARFHAKDELEFIATGAAEDVGSI